jgi:hypothetical protein
MLRMELGFAKALGLEGLSTIVKTRGLSELNFF